LDDLAGVGRTAETVKGVSDSLAEHQADTMPHRFVDGATTYKWGLSVVAGVVTMNYEEVV